MAFTPFDAPRPRKVQHFETYNRTAASQRVADIVAALRGRRRRADRADGDAALAALLAAAIVACRSRGGRRWVRHVERRAFLDRLYIPGLRRAGDLQTAAAVARGKIVIHNAGDRFPVKGPDVRAAKLCPREVVAILTGRPRR